MSESVVYVTCESMRQAETIGSALVNDRLVACVNILGGMRSLYWWEGKVCQGEETVLIAKTATRLVDTVTKTIQSLHSYEVPCVVSLPISGGNPDFLAWIQAETKCRE